MTSTPRLDGRSVRLRPAAASDIGNLVELRNSARRWFFDNRRVTPAGTRRWLAGAKANREHLWLIESKPDGIPVGCLTLSPRQDRWLEVGRMTVYPRFRRRGYMADALRAVLTYARRRRWRIFLEVLPNNRAAVQLYSKLGFHPARIRMERRG